MEILNEKDKMSDTANDAKKFAGEMQSKLSGLEQGNKDFEESLKAKDLEDLEKRDKAKMYDPDDIKKSLVVLENSLTGVEKDVKALSDDSKATLAEMQKVCQSEDSYNKVVADKQKAEQQKTKTVMSDNQAQRKSQTMSDG